MLKWRIKYPVDVWIAAAGVGMLALIGLWYLTAPPPHASYVLMLRDTLQRWLELCYAHTLFDRYLLFGIVILLTLEWWLPAEPRKSIISSGLINDSVWFVLEGIMRIGLVTIYVDLLCQFYDKHLGFMTLHALSSTPPWVRLAAVFALSDFLGWLHHYLRHKIPLFWQFHAVHHAQRELNLFTDLRYHVVDYVLPQPLIVFPFKFLAIDAPTIALFVLAQIWYTRFYHSNIRSNLGPLRYLLVTPQSHRVHHSLEARHFDTNFGVHTCLWDRLFGTYYHGEDEYPPTGITDPHFPLQHDLRGWNILTTTLRQLIYPFVSLWNKMGLAHISSADKPQDLTTDNRIP